MNQVAEASLPLFASQKAGHRRVAHMVAAVEKPPDLDELIARFPEQFNPDRPWEHIQLRYVCGSIDMDWQLETAESATTFCDRCLLADMSPAVYKVYDEADQPLYIGSTGDLVERIYNHRSNKARWLGTAVRVSVDTYKNLRFARRAEAEDIAKERPPFNKYGLNGFRMSSVGGR